MNKIILTTRAGRQYTIADANADDLHETRRLLKTVSPDFFVVETPDRMHLVPVREVVDVTICSE